MKKADIIFFGSLICAVWFLLTSAMWIYFINVFVSFPIGIVAIFLVLAGRKVEGNTKRLKVVFIIVLTGCLVAAATLIGYLIYN